MEMTMKSKVGKSKIDSDDAIEQNRWVHPAFKPLQCDRKGPFVELADGRLLTVDEQGMSVSSDEGCSWVGNSTICKGITKEPSIHYILRLRSGVLVMVYVDMSVRKFTWDERIKEPQKIGGGVYSIRSLDGGKTWTGNRKIIDGCAANYFGFIQTISGRIITSVPLLASKPGRWIVRSVFSDDEGLTWGYGNIIDLGGHGHHDGAMEPMIAELSDGRIYMLIRTNHDRFWQAFSEDDGRYWRTISPTEIDASSSPGMLLRLNSGRLVLVWNRLNPSDGGCCPKADKYQFAESPASWFREELSIAFSDDDAKTWTKPLVFARQKGGYLCYPYVFERHPGEIWICVGFTFTDKWGVENTQLPLNLKVDERAVLKLTQQ
jgi:hypothetical protein